MAIKRAEQAGFGGGFRTAAVVERVDERAEAERVDEENKFLAMLGAFLADGGEELDAFEPFFGSEVDFAGEIVEMLHERRP